MVKYAARAYAASDFALSLTGQEQKRVEQARIIYMSYVRKQILKVISTLAKRQKVDIVQIACATYLLLNCGVDRLFQTHN
jgi:hypothetical protein